MPRCHADDGDGDDGDDDGDDDDGDGDDGDGALTRLGDEQTDSRLLFNLGDLGVHRVNRQ